MNYLMHLLGVLVASACMANVIRVPEDYETIALAYENSSSGDTINIAGGTYYERLETQNKSIHFIGSTDQNGNPLTDLYVNGNGIECSGSIFVENIAIHKLGLKDSYGVFLFGGATLINVQISGFGYAIFLTSSNITLINCRVFNNARTIRRYGNFTFIGCYFEDIYAFQDYPVFPENYGIYENCTISYQDCNVYDGKLDFDHCNIEYMGNIRLIAATVKMRNSIMFQQFIPNIFGYDSLSLNFNCINFSAYNINLDTGSYLDFNDNIQLNPLYDVDHHLTEGSPCIDAGDPSSPLDPDGTRADIGAYYYCQGEGIHLPDIVRTSTEPGYPEQLTASLQSTCDAVAIDTAYTDTGLFQLDPYYPSQVASDFSTGIFNLTFNPLQQGLYADTLHILADTDPPHLKIPLVGEAGPIPAPVTDLSIAILPDQSAQLTWSPVTQTIYGNPVTPDYYLIFYNELDPQVEEEWYYQGAVATPGYLHFMVARFADLMNYRVVAWKGIDPALLGWKTGMKMLNLEGMER